MCLHLPHTHIHTHTTHTHTHTDSPSPIVRQDSWEHRPNRRGPSLRKGLSLQALDSNLDVSLLVLIHASGNTIGRKRRDVIRKTWISDIVLGRIADIFGSRVIYKYVGFHVLW